jgi:hypothetical protein
MAAWSAGGSVLRDAAGTDVAGSEGAGSSLDTGGSGVGSDDSDAVAGGLVPDSGSPFPLQFTIPATTAIKTAKRIKKEAVTVRLMLIIL